MSTQIDALPSAPAATDSVDVFDAKAFAFTAALGPFGTQANALGAEMQTNADVAAVLINAMALPQFAGTSTSSVLVGTGARNFVTQSGKGWIPGQIVVCSSGANYVKGTITAYSGTSLDVNITSTSGSGTYASWTIGLSYDGVALASSGDNRDIKSLGNNTSTIYTTGGTSTAYTITPNPAITSYAIGQSFVVNFNAASGASPTLQINGIATPPNLVRQNPDGTYSNISANEFASGQVSRVTLVSTTQALVEKLPQLVLRTAVATTSGTSIDITSIPASAKRITLMPVGMKISSTQFPMVQARSGGSPVTTGYLAQLSTSNSGASTVVAPTTGFYFANLGVSTDVIQGAIVLTRQGAGSNVWVAHWVLGHTSRASFGGGSITLASDLDGVRLTVSDGVSTYTAGSVGILIEF
jgi:hypothetical protein